MFVAPTRRVRPDNRTWHPIVKNRAGRFVDRDRSIRCYTLQDPENADSFSLLSIPGPFWYFDKTPDLSSIKTSSPS
ncbi:MAG: hypothetical protein IPN69_18885 [Acidobacteria bacterium]|nr:hypothetical protein [Acidobacteriota bacterium]